MHLLDETYKKPYDEKSAVGMTFAPFHRQFAALMYERWQIRDYIRPDDEAEH